jgi:hypothetical protein
MSSVAETTTPSTLNQERIVLTRAGYAIRMPLPPPGGLVRLVASAASRIGAQRRRIEALLNRGCDVIEPLTGRLLKIYRRTLHKSQVSTLSRLRGACDDLKLRFVHLRHFTARRDGDLAKLEAWGLIERMPPNGERMKDKARGWWGITPQGRCWLDGLTTIPRQWAFFDGQALGPVDAADRISMHQVEAEFETDEIKPQEAAPCA